MNRSFSRFLISIALLGAPLVAAAGPGMSVLDITVSPLNAAKVVAAFNKMMSSPLGEQFKGRLLLQAHVADGDNPATHLISVGYASMAEMEAYGDMVRNTEDWAKFMAALAPVSKHLGASILRDIKAWGPATVKSLSAQ
jgi:hypothetical protein